MNIIDADIFFFISMGLDKFETFCVEMKLERVVINLIQ